MALDDGTEYDKELANSQVNESTDTVYGQLQKHTDFKSPVMQRVSQQAKNAATARGLGNTTIAQQAATGAVIDKAGEFATKDAEIYSGRRNANQQAGTQLESNAMVNKANLKQTELTNTNRLEVQGAANKGALDQIAAKGVLDKDISTADRLSRETISANEITGQKERLGTELASLEKRSEADNAVKLEQAYAQIASNEKLGYLDNATKMEIAQLQMDTEVLRNNNEGIQSAWNNYQNGLSQIDPNSKPTSQQTMATRLTNSFKARMEFLKVALPQSMQPKTTTTTTTTNPYAAFLYSLANR